MAWRLRSAPLTPFNFIKLHYIQLIIAHAQAAIGYVFPGGRISGDGCVSVLIVIILHVGKILLIVDPRSVFLV